MKFGSMRTSGISMLIVSEPFTQTLRCPRCGICLWDEALYAHVRWHATLTADDGAVILCGNPNPEAIKEKRNE
jgi:L-lactate utilization protein LutB